MSDAHLTPLYSAAEVDAALDRIADALAVRHRDAWPCLVVIEHGARRLADALSQRLAARRSPRPEEVAVRARRTAGQALIDVEVDEHDFSLLRDRAVLILDDIADEGRTLAHIRTLVVEAGARTVETAVLVSKTVRREVDVPLDYIGFTIHDGWIVGFGMDLDGAYRDLDHLAVYDPQTPEPGA